MNKKGLIGTIIFIGILVVVGFFWFAGEKGFIEEEPLCVPASCCHATSCVLESEAPNCTGRLCSMSCEHGTLDCGQARCEYVDGECEVVLNE